MTVDERARAGLFLAMQYPVEVPGVSTSNFLRSAATAVRGEAPKLRTWVKEVKQAMSRPRHQGRLRRAQRQRGLLRRREEAPRGAAARAAQAEDRDPGRDRLRPGRRRAAGGQRRRQPLPRGRRDRGAADHPLHPDPAAHHPRRGARVRRRPDRRVRRARPGRRAGEDGVRAVHRGRGSCGADDQHRLLAGAGRGEDPGGLPDPVPHRARAVGRWSTSTPAPPRSVRGRCSTPSGPSWSSTTRRCTAARTSWPRRPPTPTRRPGPGSPRSSAPGPDELVFTKNATEGINLVAYAFSNAAHRRTGGRAVRAGAGRRDRGHRAGAPRQPGALAGAVPAHRCDAALVLGHR